MTGRTTNIKRDKVWTLTQGGKPCISFQCLNILHATISSSALYVFVPVYDVSFTFSLVFKMFSVFFHGKKKS